ncbi:hypothetical protein CDAR_389111 [Caerostris darwini]|uniref:Uncharacterized protein n=1 Tax=Caerostris darwini TaxID=1538125 RepID=A0AAV4N9Y0_9ARAC|nr:hypothetical protein CDAR_389111 [Caerostris darwini]
MQFPSISVLKFRWELVAGRHTAKPAQRPCSQSGSIGRLCSGERGQHLTPAVILSEEHLHNGSMMTVNFNLISVATIETVSRDTVEDLHYTLCKCFAKRYSVYVSKGTEINL